MHPLVGVLAAYKDLAPPWKELLDFYQIQQDAKIKYAQLRAQFDQSNGTMSSLFTKLAAANFVRARVGGAK